MNLLDGPARLRWAAGVLSLSVALGACSDPLVLGLPPRPASAPGATALFESVAEMPLEEREDVFVHEVLRGNVPDGLRRWQPVRLSGMVDGRQVEATIWVLPDYVAVGSNRDHALVPLTPASAMQIGDSLGAVLPTPTMVDAVWDQAVVRLGPDSIPPSPAMTTVPVFWDHDRLVRARRQSRGVDIGPLTAGHKKDVVLSTRLADRPGRVVIYGWHRPSGDPIQPEYAGHTDDWVDYSHGIRLVHRTARIDGSPIDLMDALADPDFATIFSAQGPIRVVYQE